jgi:predicted thioesterase
MNIYDAAGRSGTLVAEVTVDDTAISLGSGNVPVLATPRVVAWLEGAAVAALQGLPEEMTTVGIHISVDHTAATLVGAEVRAQADVTATEGSHIEFAVRAYEGDQIVAKGTHTRVMVDRQRFLTRAGLETGD